MLGAGHYCRLGRLHVEADVSGNDSTDKRDDGLPPLMDEQDVAAAQGEAGQDGVRADSGNGGHGNAEPVEPDEVEVVSQEESDAEWKPDFRPAYVVELEDSVKRLEEQNLELETRLSQVLVSYRKSEEETQRVRERLEREKERRLALDKQKLFRKLLEPMDNLERSLSAAKSAGDGSPLAMGVEMVWRQMLDGFQAAGLARFDPKGNGFDPELHEALGVIPVEDGELDGVVLQTEQAGYTLDGELLRPARVLVGRKA